MDSPVVDASSVARGEDVFFKFTVNIWKFLLIIVFFLSNNKILKYFAYLDTFIFSFSCSSFFLLLFSWIIKNNNTFHFFKKFNYAVFIYETI